MSWARFDDRAPHHRKVKRISDAAFRLWVTSVCYCAEYLTDGRIAENDVPQLPKVATGTKLSAAIRELVEVGLWDAIEGGGWEVHDYLDWNPTGEAVRSKREARSVAGRRGGQISGKVRGKQEANGEAIASDLLKQTPSKNEAKTNPVPVPVPVPVPKAGPLSSAMDPRKQFHTSKREPQKPPRPRTDPLFRKFPLAEWFHSQQWLDWYAENKLSDEEIASTMADVRDKLGGAHDVEWWDSRILRFFEVTIRQKTGGSGNQSRFSNRGQQIQHEGPRPLTDEEAAAAEARMAALVARRRAELYAQVPHPPGLSENALASHDGAGNGIPDPDRARRILEGVLAS